MGVWRDPRCGRSHQPKKRARYEHSSWKRPMKDVGSWRCQKNFLCILTTGRLMGVTVTNAPSTSRRQPHPKRSSTRVSQALVRDTLYDPMPGFQLLPDFGS
jgi:hypothetical protein